MYSSLSRLCLVSQRAAEPREHPSELPAGGEGARSARSLGGNRGGEDTGCISMADAHLGVS